MISPDERAALARIRTIDLTTVGRRSGAPSRIEIWWFHVDGRFVITGTPGPRDWLANVLADPSVVIHAGGRDLPATARPITDPDVRRRVLTQPETSWYRTRDELDRLVAEAPMIEVRF
ncbi:MAG: nitroreductase family deazaflavin-dependent oxidoreductase [Acidimicrobiia bacterium]|nr:nitroreductase family deazaflavin-dependent oxidoreductase [Acidimicrobiia bacterium]